MEEVTKDMLHNKKHYEELYCNVHVSDIVDRVDNFESFLEDAIKTDTSWHGLYLGDFANKITGKKCLSLVVEMA